MVAKLMATVNGGAASAPSNGKAPVVEDDDEGDVDEEGLEAADIEVIIAQTSCSRAKAVKSLRANNGDLVASIMGI